MVLCQEKNQFEYCAGRSDCDGICRFDGKQFEYFTIEQGLPNKRKTTLYNREVSLGNSIRSIQEDDKGNILIGTGDGISKFDGQSFQTLQPEKVSKVISTHMASIKNDPNEKWNKELNHLWFGEAEQNGVYRYDGQQLIHLTFPSPLVFSLSNLDANNRNRGYATYSLYKDRNGNIWFGTESQGIMKYNEHAFKVINEKSEKGILVFFPKFLN